MKTALIAFFSALLLAFGATATDGLMKKESPHSVAQTADRFEAAARERGMKVFPRFDHAAAAAEFERTMPPSVVLSVGNPKYGTQFMLENPVAGIDFPPKAIVYQDSEGKVWIAYNTAEYLYRTIFERHGLSYPEKDIEFYRGVLEDLTSKAVTTE
ncbi:MAG: DUF302 domain-containing protein [Pseudomonadota bacterium]